MTIKPSFKIGDSVKYNHSFLKSINADADISNMRGIIKEIKPLGHSTKVIYCKVLWQGDTELTGCLASNLSHLNYDITE